MLFRQLFDPDTSTYTYLLADEATREAVIIDPVIEQTDRDATLIEELGLDLVYSLDTHVHADHVTGSGKLRQKLGAKSAVSKVAGVPCVDVPLEHGDSIQFGSKTLTARSTPGHTNGCMSFVVEDEGQTYVFTGDALLIRGCGRTDFQQGNASTLYKSVHEQIFSLPENTVIYPGHDYRGHHSSTVKEEREHNKRLRTDIEEAKFIEIMNNLNLAHPKKIDIAVPANMACGLPRMDEPSVKELGPEAVGNTSRFRVIDVREPDEYTGPLGAIDHSELVPLSTVAEKAASWRRDKPLLLVCRSGRRSMKAAETLAGMGFTDLTNLGGGMLAWREHEAR